MDEELIEALRQNARLGAAVPDLINLVRERAGTGASRLAVIQYFRVAFQMPLAVAREVGGWAGFGDGDGSFSDEDVQRLVGPYAKEPVGDAGRVGAASIALVERGEIDPEWVLAFNRFVVEGLEAPTGTWAPRYFRTLHFGSMYLPIRYRVWLGSGGRRRPETEAALAGVSRVAEVALWTQALDVGEGAGHESDVAFATWVFESVEGLCAGRTPLEDWEAEYEQRLSLVDTRWDASGAWPRWSCLAVHFASFYLDVGLTRELGSVAVGGASEEETEMFRRLGQAAGDATRDIVAALITHTEAPRDSSGSLLVGNAREGARLTKVRGCSEVAILRRRPFDGPDGWL